MHRLISLLGGLCLVSCTHLAECPLRDSQGTPVVIRIPGVPKDHVPRPIQVMSIDAELTGGSDPNDLICRYLPELKGAGRATAKIDGMTGEVRTFQGETFHAYFPVLKVAAAAPQSRVDEATASMAADLLRQAKRKCRVYPMTSLALRH